MNHARAIPRYLIVGAVCALLSNAILITFDHFGIHYLVSCFVAFAVTVIIAYGLHTHWTFGAQRSREGLVRYAAAMAVNLPVPVGLLFVLVTLANMRMAIAAPLATIMQTGFNYIVASNLIRPQSRR
jgi:putative flippase GtrA